MDDVVTLYRIKNEEKWIERSIKSILDLSDRIVIFDDHSTDRTEEICRSFDKVDFVPSTFEDSTNEVRDKNFLVSYAVDKYKPLWFMCVDGDEELEPGGAIKVRSFIDKMICSKTGPNQVHFKFLYMWDSPDMVRHDGLYSRFISPRLWKASYDPSDHVYESYNDVGFHCGWVPNKITSGVPYMSKCHILHWGNLTEDVRRYKYVWYNLKDPNDAKEDRYRHIIGAGKGFKYADTKIDLVPLSAFIGNHAN